MLWFRKCRYWKGVLSSFSDTNKLLNVTVIYKLAVLCKQKTLSNWIQASLNILINDEDRPTPSLFYYITVLYALIWTFTGNKALLCNSLMFVLIICSLGMDFFQNKLPHTGRIFQTHKRLQQNESVTSIPGFRGSDNSASVGLEPEPWLSQRFIAGLIWLYRVYRQLRETRQRQNEMESLMKEIYFGLRFDNLYSLLPPPCSAEPLQMLCASFFFFFFPSLSSFIISFQSVPPAFCDGTGIKYRAASSL